MIPLSAVLITRDEEADIGRALVFARAADGVVKSVRVEQVHPADEAPVDQPFHLLPGKLVAVRAKALVAVALAAQVEQGTARRPVL